MALGHVISAGFHPTSRVGLLSHSVRPGIPAEMHPKSTQVRHRAVLFKEIQTLLMTILLFLPDASMDAQWTARINYQQL